MSSIHDYSDILHVLRPEPKYHQRMPLSDRAAQFAPFAALTGFSGMIEETGRTTEEKFILDEREKERINRRLTALHADIKDHPAVKVTYFVPDTKKDGGSYRTISGRLRKIDIQEKRIYLEDGGKADFDCIIRIKRLQDKNEAE